MPSILHFASALLHLQFNNNMNNSNTTNNTSSTSNTNNAMSASNTNTSASNSAGNIDSNMPGPLAFGVELEMLLRPKPLQDVELMKRDVGWDSEADAKDGVHRLGLLNLVECVFADTKIDVRVKRDDGPGVAPDVFDTWKVTGDATLKGESDGYCMLPSWQTDETYKKVY